MDSPRFNITVVGVGYVGLVTAACFAEWGHCVTGIDTNPERAKMLRAGRTPFHEPGLDDLVVRGLSQDRLRFTDRLGDAIAGSDLVFVAVGTHDGNGGWQTGTMLSCLRDVVPALRDDSVLVIRSTLPPEFVRQLGDIAGALRDQAGLGPVSVLVNPEFTREGAAISDFVEPERVVVGVAVDLQEAGVTRLRQLYEPIDAPILVMPAVDAALAKLGSNLFLATKISFVNEYASLCDSFGASIDNVVAAMAHDSRIGGKFLRAGVGFGGSCLPHQVTMTVRTAAAVGVPAPLLSAVDEVNHRRRSELVDRLVNLIGRPMPGARVAMLGLTFKPHTDDLRDAPSLTIARLLLEHGAQVVAFDPMPTARTLAVQLVPGLHAVETPEAALDGADAAAIITEWPEVRSIDWQAVRGLMRGDLVFDGRNSLNSATVQAAGYRYAGFGRGDGTTQPAPAEVPAVLTVEAAPAAMSGVDDDPDVEQPSTSGAAA